MTVLADVRHRVHMARLLRTDQVSLLPLVTHLSGPLYLLRAPVFGGRFLFWACVLYRGIRPHAAICRFEYSVYYQLALFIALFADHYLLLTL